MTLRASSEQDEGNKTALGQLLERTIRTTVSFEEPLTKLKKQLEQEYKEIVGREQNALTQRAISLLSPRVVSRQERRQ